MSAALILLAACTATRDGGAGPNAPQTRCWDIACAGLSSRGCTESFASYCDEVCEAEDTCGGSLCADECGRSPIEPTPDASVEPCDDSCQYANDGECDEPTYCATGTDCSDCGGTVGGQDGGVGCTPSCGAGSCGDDGCGGDCTCDFGTMCNASTSRCEARTGYCYTAFCDGSERNPCFEDLSSYCGGFCSDLRSGRCTSVTGLTSCNCF